MAIIIDHGTSLPGMQDATQNLVGIILHNRARKDAKDRQDREEQRQDRLDKEQADRMAQIGARADAAEARATEDQGFQREDRARAIRARKDIGRAQDVQFQGDAGVQTENDPSNLGSISTSPPTPPAQVQVPRGLPKELWPEFYRVHQQLAQTEDPGARQQIIQQAKQDWTRFASLKGIDELSRTMSHDIDTGSFQADPESAPDPREQEMLDQVGEQQRQIGEIRKKASQDGAEVDPKQIEAIRKSYLDLKTKLADVHAAKQVKNSALAEIEQTAGKWAGSRSMGEKFASLTARVRTNVITPKEGLQEADKLAREPEMYGEGQPLDAAAPPVRQHIHKEAVDLMHEAYKGDSWDQLAPQQKAQALAQGLPHFVAIVAQQYGWNPQGQSDQPQDMGGPQGMPAAQPSPADRRAALDAAQKDMRWIQAKTPEERKGILDEYAGLLGRNAPTAAPKLQRGPEGGLPYSADAGAPERGGALLPSGVQSESPAPQIEEQRQAVEQKLTALVPPDVLDVVRAAQEQHGTEGALAVADAYNKNGVAGAKEAFASLGRKKLAPMRVSESGSKKGKKSALESLRMPGN